MSLHIAPIGLRAANEFVRMQHRHHRPARGHKFSIGIRDGELLVGVAIVGRPVARRFDDGQTLEVVRTCTDGTKNANSMLYGACWRAARAMGFRRLITYTQSGETGASLRGAGWKIVAQRPARAGWDAPTRPRVNRNDHIPRTLWEAAA